jgi:hypothetical protein
MQRARRGSLKIPRGGSSKGNFMDYIEKASKDAELRDDLLTEAYKPGETPERLLTFFTNKGYYGVSYEDCQKLINIVKAGELPCDFSTAIQY